MKGVFQSVELRQLEYFCEVSKLGSFTRAAEHLYVTQPSITNAIHKLEQELNLQLFDRRQKKPVLTAEGVYFYREITPVLQKINHILKGLENLRNLSQGIIKIAIPPIIGTYLFPTIFGKFNQCFPGLKLQLYEEGSWNARQMLERGELDIGIIILPHQTDTLESKKILEVPWVVCVSPNHPLAKRTKISFQDLAQERLITLKKDSYQYNLTFAQFRQHGVEPNIVLSSSQVETIKALVAQNMGVAILMDLVFRNDSNLVAIPLEEPVTIEIGVAWKKGSCLSHAAQAFLKFIDENFKDGVMKL